MTDRETLFAYRLGQAEETLADAQKMLAENLSPRSVVNRAYYAMFYAVMALFLHRGINPKTSKHSGVIAIFDKEFVHAGLMDKRYSKQLHKLFEARQEADYKELVTVSREDAVSCVAVADEFLGAIRSFVVQNRGT
ncbi:HEPN domain-containing protein [Geobacter sp.]|uniref:HEPN domain-containing protein n=1 Tax=Geobacter sp. TaxID=46610 RepID=UPI002615B3E3|nr:HEPN domain-containing protein [Geobacter sp.]